MANRLARRADQEPDDFEKGIILLLDEEKVYKGCKISINMKVPSSELDEISGSSMLPRWRHLLPLMGTVYHDDVSVEGGDTAGVHKHFARLEFLEALYLIQ